MKNVLPSLFCLGLIIGTLILSSCTTRTSEEQWKLDHARYQEELKHYPDRESTDQRKADAEAARKADNLHQ